MRPYRVSTGKGYVSRITLLMARPISTITLRSCSSAHAQVWGQKNSKIKRALVALFLFVYAFHLPHTTAFIRFEGSSQKWTRHCGVIAAESECSGQTHHPVAGSG